MKKTAVNRFLTMGIIIALFLVYSASSNGLVLCIGELGHVQIESKIPINYDKNVSVFIDNMQSNIYFSPTSRCGSCENIEL